MAENADPALIIVGVLVTTAGVGLLLMGIANVVECSYDLALCNLPTTTCGFPVVLLGVGLILVGALRREPRGRRRAYPAVPPVSPPLYCEVCGARLVYVLGGFGRCETCRETRYFPPSYR